jgi:hypothetical protein
MSYFSPLKRAYGQEIQKQITLSINHINKDEFLTIYSSVRTEALNKKNIQSGFRATGLAPYNPEQVLSRLNTQMKTPTPPGSSHSSQASWITATPHNIRQVELQTEKIKGYMRHRTQSLSSPTNRALNQLVKGYQIAMQSAALLAAENRELRAANEKQKRKRKRRRTYIGQEEALTIEEGIDRVRRANKGERGVMEVEEISENQPRKRAAPRCSVCNILGHTARTCSQRTGNSS